MLFDYILLGLLILGLLGLLGLVIAKWPILRLINTDEIKKLKQQEVKKELVEAKLKRQLKHLHDDFLKMSQPVSLKFKQLKVSLVSKLEGWEGKAEKELHELTSPAKRQADYLAKADDLIKQDKIAEAEHIYLDLIQGDPNNLELYRMLAELYMEKRDYEAAHEVYEYLVEKGSTASFLGLARAASGQGLLEEARGQYLKTIDYNNSVQPRLELAKLLQQMGNNKDALLQLTEARKIEPNNPKILDFYIELSIVNGQLTEAQSALDDLREVNPDNQKISDFARQIRGLAEKNQPKRQRATRKLSTFGMDLRAKK